MTIDKLDQKCCTGCKICFSVCPQDVFRMDDLNGKAFVRYPDDCVSCWSCELLCPVGCIKVSEPRPLKLPAPY